jgi:uncharacterized damage-inducible protein DinB
MNQTDLVIKQATDSWNLYITRINKLLDTLTDEQLSKDIAPGRNSGMYLLGHLAAVNDAMLPLLGFGPLLHPEMEDIFVEKPDKAVELPASQTIREYWKQTCEALSNHFSKMTVDGWLSRHNSISETDFQKEPHRNKLNVLLNRTNHLSYHHGQLVLLGSAGSE